MDFRRFKLPSGARVVAAKMSPDMPVTLQVWFLGGSRAEKDNEVNLAHLTEHLVFLRGGRDFPDSRSAFREFRLLGEKGNAATSDEFMFYFLTVSPFMLKRAAHLLSDMVIHANIDPGNVENERSAVRRELKSSLDDPDDFSERRFKKMIFGRHELGRMDSEVIHILDRLSAEDVAAYKKRCYGWPNAVISVAGGIDFSETADILEEYFGQMPGAEKIAWPRFQPEETYPAVEIIERGDLKTAHLYLGGFAPPVGHADLRVSSVLHEILSNRLWFELRDTGYVYSVFSETRVHTDAGHFIVYAGVDNDRDDVAKALDIMFYEMADIKAGKIGDTEIEEAKAVKQALLYLGFEGSGMTASFLGSSELHTGCVKTPSEIQAEVERVTRDDILRLANELWCEKNVRSLLMAAAFPNYEEIYRHTRSWLAR